MSLRDLATIMRHIGLPSNACPKYQQERFVSFCDIGSNRILHDAAVKTFVARKGQFGNHIKGCATISSNKLCALFVVPLMRCQHFLAVFCGWQLDPSPNAIVAPVFPDIIGWRVAISGIIDRTFFRAAKSD